MKSTVEDQERKDKPVTGAESGMVVMGKKVVIQSALVSVGCLDKFYKRDVLTNEIPIWHRKHQNLHHRRIGKGFESKNRWKTNLLSFLFGSTKAKQRTSPMVDLVIKIKAGKATMIKATCTPQMNGLLKRVRIQLENQRKIQKFYPLADTFPKK